jgi:hypothetical protein
MYLFHPWHYTRSSESSEIVAFSVYKRAEASMSKRVLLFVHVEESPGDSGMPLAVIASEPDPDPVKAAIGNLSWNYEVLETGEKGRPMARPDFALAAAFAKLGLL